LPTPNTHEPFRVVTTDVEGAPLAALAFATAPIAPAPPVPEGSAPVNATTVIEAATLWDKLAVTVTFVSLDAAKALQISAVPNCPFARCTSDHVKPAPVTLAVIPRDCPSVATNARSNSFVVPVLNDGDTMLLPEVDLSVKTITFVPNAPQALAPANSTAKSKVRTRSPS
jgi:hypothetical protein